MTLLTTIVLASLFGSLHCAGMCGPLVAFAVDAGPAAGSGRRWSLPIAYHGGRLVTYVVLGAVAGLVGAAVDMGGALLGLNRLAAVLAGSMMVFVGLVAIAQFSGFHLPYDRLPYGVHRLLNAARRAALRLRPVHRAAVMGLLTGFLPCGWLYAFVIVAAGTGSSLTGAAVMLAFWVGTVPVLAFVGIGAQSLTALFGRHLPVATALVVVGLGLYTIAARPMITLADVRPALDSAADHAEDAVTDLHHSDLPCCQPNVTE